MPHSTPTSRVFISLARNMKRLQVSDPLTQCLAPRLSRRYATHADIRMAEVVPIMPEKSTHPSANAQTSASKSRAVATLYTWPSMEPSSFTTYPAHHLNLPLRRDILHRAVIYEGDNARQGSASTKHRTQVSGSSRKVRPQKGTGSARLSDRKSPSIRGGGVAHGPHPRNFATDLPRKIYDLAWRTALSFRYKKGELIILSNKVGLSEGCTARWLNNFFITHGWGKGNGRTLVVRHAEDEQDGAEAEARLLEGMDQIGEHVKLRNTFDVDVKDLLSCGRVIIEREALQKILRARSPNVV